MTISFGHDRIFRLSRRSQGVTEKVDFAASDGVVFVMPYATNRVWKHEVPHFARHRGRRMSVTVRAFYAV